jgi:SAM-dependent methyltransferase
MNSVDDFKEDTYGERVAGIYDEWYSEVDEEAVRTLCELAQGGRALELGIGTGRIALPLQQKGIAVHGIDASPAMVAKLRNKPSGEKIPVTMGNFADINVEGQFKLIYVLFNTFYALLTQDEQLRCFHNAAQHLEPQGVFLIEVFVPDLSRFSGEQAVRAVRIDENEVRLDASLHDAVNQIITSQHMVLTEPEVRLYPVKLRYVWPSELDLMARLAGLQRIYRWGNWRKEAFTAISGKHISIYQPIPSTH